jgi:hypothetical protein
MASYRIYSVDHKSKARRLLGTCSDRSKAEIMAEGYRLALAAAGRRKSVEVVESETRTAARRLI